MYTVSFTKEKWTEMWMSSQEIERFANAGCGRPSSDGEHWEYGMLYDFDCPETNKRVPSFLRPAVTGRTPGQLPMNRLLRLRGGEWDMFCLISGLRVYYDHCGYGQISEFTAELRQKFPTRGTIPSDQFIFLLESFDPEDTELSRMRLDAMILLSATGTPGQS